MSLVDAPFGSLEAPQQACSNPLGLRTHRSSHTGTAARSLLRLEEDPIRTVSAAIEINYSPMDVWAVLTDFSSYRDWNPQICDAQRSLEKA
jgi:hypothetical protein